MNNVYIIIYATSCLGNFQNYIHGYLLITIPIHHYLYLFQYNIKFKGGDSGFSNPVIDE